MRLSELIGRHYRNLTDNERIVCRYMLRNLDTCPALSVRDLAQACHVSNAIITRFSQKLGFSGFSELRACIRLETSLETTSTQSLVAQAADGYQRLVNSMVAHDLTTTLDRLLSAERTVVYADDRSVTSVASEAKRIFMPLLELIQVYSAQDCQTLCMSKQKGSALIISGARHSRETVALIHILQLYKTYTLCITSEHGSECALAADDTLYVGTTRADAPPDATRTPVVAPYLLAIEMLYLSLREHTLRSHPGLAAVSQANVE